MVRKNGKEGYRSFTLVGASETSGCRTKGYGGRFINKSPQVPHAKHLLICA